jgi:hypothetical protein
MKRGFTLGAGFAALAVVLVGCEAVPYRIDPNEAALLPNDTALRYLQSLPRNAAAVAPRPDEEYCEFSQGGLRVAAANPVYARGVVEKLNAELRDITRDKAATEREQHRVEAEQKDRVRWMQRHGFAEFADEQRRLDGEQRNIDRAAQTRSYAPEQIAGAQARLDKAKREFADRTKAVDSAMAKDRQELTDRMSALEARERAANTKITETNARVHDPAHYDRAAFVVVRKLRGETLFDVQYEVPGTKRVDGCGFSLDDKDPGMQATMQKMATALAALGAEGQSGVRAEPPVGDGRRYSASNDQPVSVSNTPR